MAAAASESGDGRRKNKRVGIKAQSVAKQQQKPSNVQKSVGANKAKRNAKISSKRGLSDTSKATPMQVEREVYRQSRTGSGGGGVKNSSDSAPKRSRRGRGNEKNLSQDHESGRGKRQNASNKTVADQKTKQKNLARQKKSAQQQQEARNAGAKEEIVKPPKKVIGVAKKAMQDAGFIPPKGMKMVVSFVAPEKKNNDGNLNKSKIQQGQKGGQKEQSANNAGGGNRKGRWLKRIGEKMKD
jgi:hypothetical protein